jgi:hypothetical protein
MYVNRSSQRWSVLFLCPEIKIGENPAEKHGQKKPDSITSAAFYMQGAQ